MVFPTLEKRDAGNGPLVLRAKSVFLAVDATIFVLGGFAVALSKRCLLSNRRKRIIAVAGTPALQAMSTIHSCPADAPAAGADAPAAGPTAHQLAAVQGVSK